MSNEDREKTLAAAKALTREVTTSREKALDFLVSMGLLTPDGELTPQYRSNA